MDLQSRVAEGEFWLDETEFLSHFDDVTVGYPISDEGHLKNIYTGNSYMLLEIVWNLQSLLWSPILTLTALQQEICWHTAISWLAGGWKDTVRAAAVTAAATAATLSSGSKCVREERCWCRCCSIGNGETRKNMHKRYWRIARTQSTSTTRLSLYTYGRFVTSVTGGYMFVSLRRVTYNFFCHQVEKKRFNLSRMLNKPPCASTHCHAYEREVVLHGDLEPGYYLLIPSTYQPGAEARFLIRVFSSSSTSLR